MITSKEAELLLALIQQGQCPNAIELATLQNFGFWLLSEGRKTLIASKKILLLRQSLNTDLDTVAAIVATQTIYQQAWAKIVAAQLNDAAARKDINALSEQISLLGSGANAVLSLANNASLNPSDFKEIESLVFGQGAEQSASYPKLLRALATGATLFIDSKNENKSEENEATLLEIFPIDQADVTTFWQAQRLIELPTIEGVKQGCDYHLNGLVKKPSNDLDDKKTIDWLMNNPWAYLLAQIIYTQDIWRSEQIAGGLVLEIDPSQIKHFMQPNAVQVVVTTITGQEVNCGSLAELILRVLDALAIHLLSPLKHQQQIESLNATISPLIGFMIKANVWQFIEGSSKDIPQYKTHSHFDRIPTSRIGSIYFARPGKRITAAIREQAESWANELVWTKI
ncbi:MAG: hypothetical protein ACJAS1_002557 [Oleiphilaceae bacterium]|jgi:hypothetical protein